MNNLEIKEVYDLIEKSRARYGVFKKCELHLHTPVSYDYELIKGKKYNQISLEEIYDLSISTGYLNRATVKLIKDKEDEYLTSEYIKQIRKNTPYDNFKEYLAYLIIAHKLYKEDIEVVIISDHNTFSGYKKLKYALIEYYKERIKSNAECKKSCIDILPGIEISCSDKQHLIVIVNEKKLEELNKYLNEIFLSEKEGTYLDSRYLIEYLSIKFDAITYLAHLNSSDYLGSNAYNKKLFGLEELKIIGTKDVTSIESIKNRISNYIGNKVDNYQYVLEGDAHNIDDIGTKVTWIKCNNMKFASLKKVIENSKICIRVVKPNGVNRYIKGIVINPGNNGFLINKKDNNSDKTLILPFSKDLNCIIGGRGSGKSTLINILQTALTLEADDLNTLDFISNHKIIYCTFYLDGVDYILRFIPQKKDKNNYYYLGIEDLFFGIQELNGRIYLSNVWIELYKVDDGDVYSIDKNEYPIILGKIFRRSYNINKLVSKINDGSVSDFIRDIVTYGISYNKIEEFEKIIKTTQNKSFIKMLKGLLPEIIEYLNKRKDEISVYINKFNKENEKVIEILYSPKEKELYFYLKDILNLFMSRKNIEKTYLTWEQSQVFIFDAVNKIGYLHFLELILNNQYKKIQSIIQIEKYIDRSELTFSSAELGLEDINSVNISKVYTAIRDKLKENRQLLQDSILKCFKVTDDFTINFNINSKESIDTEPCIMKNIEELSLGQKVVALLDLVFNFGVSCDDSTPLIIDQPEDNLDNQYIYKNLVNSLKRIKSLRQVIVVTHNSTIVTNADSEQVIVMNSDNKNGWIERIGYPAEKNIIKHIVNYMEGGEDSFKHKKQIYSLFIPSLK